VLLDSPSLLLELFSPALLPYLDIYIVHVSLFYQVFFDFLALREVIY
jgi:hypothetical protein